MSSGKFQTHAASGAILPASPLLEARSPVVEVVLLGVLDPVSVAESALSPSRGQDPGLVQIHLEVLLDVPGDHVLGAPGAAALLLP